MDFVVSENSALTVLSCVRALERDLKELEAENRPVIPA